MKKSDFEIHDKDKLDKVLVKLCSLVINRQKKNPDHYGMVGACIIDNDNNMVFETSSKNGDKWVHAEKNAMESYESKHGEIPKGSIIVTTLSPCNEKMHDRYGSSCTDVINGSNVRKVYCGYDDPTQNKHKNKFTEEVTDNSKLTELCKMFADTFLNLNENFADGRNPQDKGDSKRYNVPTKGSISSLRKIAKQGGRRGQLAHWMANMKSGRKK